MIEVNLPNIAVLATAFLIGMGSYFFISGFARIAMLLFALSLAGVVSYSISLSSAFTLFTKAYLYLDQLLGATVTAQEFIYAFVAGVVVGAVVDFARRRGSASRSPIATY